MPDFSYEEQYTGTVCGVDEVGRGCLAGPVVACAVVYDKDRLPPSILEILDDSKKLTKKKREALYPILIENCTYAIGVSSVEEIDSINILQASLLAMQKAVESLPVSVDTALIDGTMKPALQCQMQTIIKGDSISLCIAMASIIAKVYRDALMGELTKEYPYYDWQSNAGYGTRKHKEGLKQHGITSHHRKSFAPIKEYVEGDT